jgi:hypothetical protein
MEVAINVHDILLLLPYSGTHPYLVLPLLRREVCSDQPADGSSSYRLATLGRSLAALIPEDYVHLSLIL